MTETQKGREHIFTFAREAINYLAARIVGIHGFGSIEGKWRVTSVISSNIPEENEVKFVTSRSIQDLVKEQYKLYSPDGNGELMNFVPIKGPDGEWEITVQASGVESYYFARMLFMGVNKLSRKVFTQEHLDRKLINMYLEYARPKSIGLPRKIKIKPNGTAYSLSCVTEKGSWQRSWNNIDFLCAFIGQNFKGGVEFK